MTSVAADVTSVPGGRDPQIIVDSVSKSFSHGRSSVQALSDCSLDVARHEFVSLVGPSGCGKSTLLRIIGGLAQQSSGTVTVFGQSPDERRNWKYFGFVPQAPALLPWRTVLQNAELLRELNPKHGNPNPPVSIDELIEIAGLSAFRDSYPAQLSGGMQQRVALVRAFALGPAVLLLDEPFAALDEMTRERMRYTLLDMWMATKGSVVLVTHNIQEAVVLSDRVYVMSGRPGRVLSTVDIDDLPRPRTPEIGDSPAAIAHVAAIRRCLYQDDAPPKSQDGQ